MKFNQDWADQSICHYTVRLPPRLPIAAIDSMRDFEVKRFNAMLKFRGSLFAMALNIRWKAFFNRKIKSIKNESAVVKFPSGHIFE